MLFSLISNFPFFVLCCLKVVIFLNHFLCFTGLLHFLFMMPKGGNHWVLRDNGYVVVLGLFLRGGTKTIGTKAIEFVIDKGSLNRGN